MVFSAHQPEKILLYRFQNSQATAAQKGNEDQLLPLDTSPV